MRFAIFLLSLVAALALVSPLAGAQKLGKTWHEDEQVGFKFKPLDDYAGIPLQPNEAGGPLIAKFSGPNLIAKRESGDRVQVGSDITVFAMFEREQEGTDGRTTAKTRREDVAEYLERRYRGFSSKIASKPEVDEAFKGRKLEARHRTWKVSTDGITRLYDAYTFTLPHADVSLLLTVVEEEGDDYLKVFEKSAKTFAEIERVEVAELTAGATYEDQLAAAEREAEKIEGWQALPTPSGKFIIMTSSDNRKFIKDVIERLEKSRELYEQDFPPPPNFDAVSIVRICGTEEEFHKYGGTGGGVAGWFSPSSEELVLYDAVLIDRNMSFAVMSHEAFHQYCHFLFNQSEAHRWFDEGHGDYYGGVETKGSRAKVKAQMPGGLDRLGEIREMVRAGTYKPLEDHLNYSHPEWQSQGPSNVSCYAQSWSIIYMLRQGALGKVSRKCWEKEYAEIIPNYVSTLAAGYKKVYDEIRAERIKKAEAEGREPTEEELKVNRFDLMGLRRGATEEIWKQAMDASWGQIDLDKFQEDWLVYIDKYLK